MAAAWPSCGCDRGANVTGTTQQTTSQLERLQGSKPSAMYLQQLVDEQVTELCWTAYIIVSEKQIR